MKRRIIKLAPQVPAWCDAKNNIYLSKNGRKQKELKEDIDMKAINKGIKAGLIILEEHEEKEVKKATEDINVKVGSIESTMEDNNVEIEDIKKGLANALVSSGVNANVGMTWKELFELVLKNASGEPGGSSG